MSVSTMLDQVKGAEFPGQGSVLGCGAWLKNAACLWSPQASAWSPIHGDLDSPDARASLERSVGELVALSGGSIRAVAHDLHPDFYSTELALRLANQLNLPAIGVQHHHAHIGAVIAAHQLQEPVIGLALDGVGLGSDGQAWGGELLWVDGPTWERLGCLHPLPLPGGDRAAREPWRMAASLLDSVGQNDQIAGRFGQAVGTQTASGVATMLRKRLNCPLTSSAGRWFDAIAGILALSVRQQEEAQAAQALEQHARNWITAHGLPVVVDRLVIDAENRLDPSALFRQIVNLGPEQSGHAAAQFHVALVNGLFEWVVKAGHEKGCSLICLAGGCFYNQILLEQLTEQLTAAGYQVYLPGQYGCGDAGLAIGQAWVAGQQLNASSAAAGKGLQLCV